MHTIRKSIANQYNFLKSNLPLFYNGSGTNLDKLMNFSVDSDFLKTEFPYLQVCMHSLTVIRRFNPRCRMCENAKMNVS